MPDRLSLRYAKLLPHAIPPTSAHGPTEDAGMDLFAAEPVTVPVRGWKSIRTGLALEIPPGYDAQIRPRSGLAVKHGITLLNSPGTLDPGYRGELLVTLVNLGLQPYRIRSGDRIAQLILARYVHVDWRLSPSLPHTDRGTAGFGSTGR